jgi:hypothetical protein
MTTISIRIAGSKGLTAERPAAGTLPLPSVSSLATRWFRSVWCVINGGHFKVLHTEPDRLALRCVACGHTSPGWEVGAARVGKRTASTADRTSDRVRVRRPVAA